jgi:MFS family permease
MPALSRASRPAGEEAAALSTDDSNRETPRRGGDSATLASLVLPVYMPAALLSTGSAAMTTFLPLFLQELGASVGLAAAVIGIGSAGVLVFDLPSGFVTARYGERPTLIVSGIVMIAGALLTAASRNLWVAGLGIFLAYASASFWFLGRLSFLRNALRVDLRGRGLATAGGVMRIGQLAGPVAGGFLAQAAGFRWIFYGTAALAFASLLFFALFERGVARARAPARGAAAPTDLARSFLDLPASLRVFRAKRRIFMTAGVSMVILSLVRGGRALIFPLWGQQIGLDTSAIGLAVGLSSAVDTVMFYPAGALSDRLGRRWSAVSCLVVLSASLAFVPLTHDFTWFLVVGLVVGFGNGLGSGINMTLAADFASGAEPEVFLGLWRLVTDIGVAGAPLLIGAIAGTLAMGPAVLVIAALGLGGAWFHARSVQETLLRRPRAHGP